MASIVVMTGGGIKGAVAAARYAADHEITFLHLDYGQRSAPQEAEAVRALAKTFPTARSLALELPHVAEIPKALGRTGTPTGTRPASRISESPALPGAALRGLMPVLAAVGVQCALQVGAKQVVAGISRFIDATPLGLPGLESEPNRCRAFVHAFNIMIDALVPRRPAISLEVPLIDATHAEVVKLARHFHIPLENTWSCAQPAARPCGRCDPCTVRAAAFAEAGISDPLVEVVPA